MSSLAYYHGYIPPLLTPLHGYVPFPAMDVFGAMRLSMIVNWVASGAFDSPPHPEPVNSEKQNGSTDPSRPMAGASGKKKGTKKVKKERAGLLQELVGIAAIVFGGETFLCMLTGTTPSWMLNPSVVLLFWAIHTLQTRTPLINLLPSKPNLLLELLLAIPDGIGRALLVTKFSMVPLLHPVVGSSTLPATPSTLILVPFIVAVPFAAIMFSGLNIFSPSPKLSVPAELQPYGWVSPDAWAPVVCPALFLSLIGPVKGWSWGLGWTEEEAFVAVAAFLVVIFEMRTVYNLGSTREQWSRALGGRRKLKTA